jgi:hypothetical protein
MTVALDQARAVRAKEADRREAAQAALERCPPAAEPTKADAIAARWTRFGPSAIETAVRPKRNSCAMDVAGQAYPPTVNRGGYNR